MKRSILVALFTFLIAFAKAQKIMGFIDAGAGKQIDWEKQFDANLNAKNLDEWMHFMSSHPHHVGSVQDKANAEYMANLFRQWGYQTEIASYYVLFPTPKTRLLELTGSKPYKAKLQESGINEDKTSMQLSEQLPSYNAYSADGDVTAELVFVNRGVPADYEELERMGIDVKGKIVIAKYGGSWRGIKPKVAYEHGAIGCIIYSDPADDGYAQGDVYPTGAFRPADGVQRGSVMDMPVYPGDPLTPNVGATKAATRLDIKDAKTIMRIPVLPISYEDALPLLQSLGGAVVPASWRGALPITYHVGPSKEKVHLKLAFNWEQKQLYNVIATMKGSELPDEWVLRGNHHDGWVNGADDPLSGMVSLMEEARAIGELAKKGFSPKRTIVYCAWDGEEPALLGSTEWVEDHQEELKQKAVVYINSDANGRGFIGASGSHTLETFFNEVANEVIDPQTGVTIKERKYANTIYHGQKLKPKTRSSGISYMILQKIQPNNTNHLPLKKWSLFLNFSTLENALAQLKDSSEAIQKLYSKAIHLPTNKQKELNGILYKAERTLINEKGLPRRNWYRHEIYAPGYYTGYGVKTLPGIREAIEQRNWTEAQENIDIVARTLQSYLEQVKQAIIIMK